MIHGSLFTGIGGFDLAAQWAGIKTVWQCEKDEYCRRVLARHFPEAKRYDDITTLRNPEAVDIISGGFPCQPFSVAGKRRGKEDDRYLWPEMLRVISEVRPTWVIGENVAGIINMELDQVLFDLEEAGYSCEAFVIPAVAVDAPHRRDRVWIIAYTDSNDSRSRWTKPEGLKRKTGVTNGREIMANSNSHHGYRWRRNVQMGRIGIEGETERDGDSDRTQWPAEPGILRVAHGVPNRVDRLRGLGNAIVPQVAYQIFRAIVAVEEQIKEQSA